MSIKTKLIEKLGDEAIIRTCQECGHIQEASSNPYDARRTEKSWNVYCDVKCKKCKSESLDFGTRNASWDYPEEE